MVDWICCRSKSTGQSTSYSLSTKDMYLGRHDIIFGNGNGPRCEIIRRASLGACCSPVFAPRAKRQPKGVEIRPDKVLMTTNIQFASGVSMICIGSLNHFPTVHNRSSRAGPPYSLSPTSLLLNRPMKHVSCSPQRTHLPSASPWRNISLSPPYSYSVFQLILVFNPKS